MYTSACSWNIHANLIIIKRCYRHAGVVRGQIWMSDFRTIDV